MSNFNGFKNGSGVRFSAVVEGEVVNFKLALALNTTYSLNQRKELVFVCEEYPQFITKGCYSGGETGFGVDEWRNLEKPNTEYKILTTDLDVIIGILKAEDEEKEKEENERIERKKLAVKNLNKLPKETPLIETYSYSFIIERETASFDEKRKMMNFGYKVVRKDKETGDKVIVRTDDFFKNSGKFSRSRTKKYGPEFFGRDFENLMGNSKIKECVFKINEKVKNFDTKVNRLKIY